MILENKCHFELELDNQEDKLHSFSALLSGDILVEIRHDKEKSSMNFKLFDLNNKMETYGFSVTSLFGSIFYNLLKGHEKMIGFQEQKTIEKEDSEIFKQYYNIAFVSEGIDKYLRIINLKKKGDKWKSEISEKSINFEVPTDYVNCSTGKLHLYDQKQIDNKTHSFVLYTQTVGAKFRVILFDINAYSIKSKAEIDLSYLLKESLPVDIELNSTFFEKDSKTLYLLYQYISNPHELFLIGYSIETHTLWKYNITVKPNNTLIKGMALSDGKFYILLNSNTQTSSRIILIDTLLLKKDTIANFESFKLADDLTAFEFNRALKEEINGFQSAIIPNCVFDGTFIIDKSHKVFAILNLQHNAFYIVSGLNGKTNSKHFNTKKRSFGHSNYMVSTDHLCFVESMSRKGFLREYQMEAIDFRFFRFADKKGLYAFLITSYNSEKLNSKLKDAHIARILKMLK